MKRQLFSTLLTGTNRGLNAVKVFFFTILLCGVGGTAFANITVIPATGGTNICSSVVGYTTLGTITIEEGLDADLGNSNGFWNVTLTISAPAGWQFNTASTIVLGNTTIGGADINTGGVTQTGLTTTALTISITGNGKAQLDTVTIAGLQVEPTSTSSAAGNITTTLGFMNVATGIITGTTGTNFGSLSLTPTAITGTSTICLPGGTALTDATGSGVWSSSNTNLANVDGAGTVTGVADGSVNISYTVAGCTTIKAVTVTSPAPAITGPTTVCQNSTITLSNTSPGGTWTSTPTTAATVTAATGVVTGVAVAGGTAVITYAITGCGSPQTYTVTVNPRPGTITASATSMCVGGTITVTDGTTGGTWSSTTSSVATILSAGPTVSGVAAGTSTISYTLSSNGCARTVAVTVLTAPSTTFGGPSQVCVGSSITLSNSTAGGTWSATGGGGAPLFVNATTGVVTGANAGVGIVTYSVGSCGTATVAITVNALPSTITGTTTLCVGLTTILSDATPGGTWSSGTTTVATIPSAGTTVTGVGPGTSAISYVVTATGCVRTTNVTVKAPPSAIGGVPIVCTGFTTVLTNTVTGGTWSSGTSSVGTVNTTGRVGGVLGGTTVISYSVTTCPAAVITVTVNATPPAITGTAATCIGSTTILSDATAGGVWSSVSTGVATILPGGTTVTGVSAGTSVISYQITATGCATSTIVTVNTPPSATFTGNPAVCAGLTTTLSNSVGGGVWTSGTTSVATVTSGAGVVRGVAAGTTIISYSTTACPSATVTLTVNAIPIITGGPATICTGGPTTTITLSDNIAAGLWSSSANSVATVGSVNGTVTAVTAGNTQITYSITATGCMNTTTVTVNAPPASITGTASVCTGATTALSNTVTGGVWSSSNSTEATVTNGLVTGGAVTGTPIISYAITSCPTATLTVTVNQSPNAITGAATAVCQRSSITLSDAGAGVWSSSNTFRATVSGGVVTGAATGGVTISYTLGSCTALRTLTVNTTPVAIVGNTTLCTGTITHLSDVTAGGTWSSTTSSVATVVAGTGVVSGTTAGTSVMTYQLITGCQTTTIVTVNQSPDPITGVLHACVGQGTTLSDDITGGTWTSANTNDATIDYNSGAVSGIVAGTVPVTYTEPVAGCIATATLTINSVPSTITGINSVCVGVTTTLSNTSPGGNWSVDNTSIATVDPSGGVLTGVSGGVANVTYDFGATCAATATITVNPLAFAGSISGPNSVCLGTVITLSNTASGGTWSTDNTAIATVDASGNVSGVAVGNVNVLYSVTNGCGTIFVSVPMTVDLFTPSVTVSALPGFSSCVDSVVTFTANAVFGGATPSYQWTVNGVPSSVTGTLIYTPLNGDTVICIMTSNAACVSSSIATDTAIMTVNPNLAAGVTISTGIVGDTICAGTLTSFTASAANGGVSPSYQWYVDGSLLGTTNPFNYTPDSNDVVVCVLTSSYQCATPATVTSNSVTMTVNTVQVPAVTITASANPTCLGTPVTFTAHPLYGGLSPFFRWTQDGINVATGPTYTTIPANGDAFYCTMKSSSACSVLDSVFSIPDPLIEVVDSPIVPVVTVHAATNIIGIGEKDTLRAVVTPAIIIAPTYQWYLNGVAIPGATMSYYVAQNGAAGVDYYYCIAGNGNVCNTTSLSNLITLNVDAVSVPQVATGEFDLKLVPNPNGGTFTVEGTISSENGDVAIEITNIVGQVVYKGTATVQNGTMNKQIALGNELTNGVYMLHIITGNAHKVIRFSLGR